MDLMRTLLEKSSSVENIATSWWSFYRINAAEAFGILTELMFQAGGWVTFKYKRNGFPTVETYRNVKEYGPLSLVPGILDPDDDFQCTFRNFISLIAEYDRCRILYDQHFFIHIGKMFELLSYGKWDAFRLVAFITGRQLWYSLEKEFFQRRHFPSQHWQLLLKEHIWAYSRIQNEMKPYHDFLFWSIYSPAVLLDETWHHTILCWLREKSVQTKSIAHLAVYHLFRRKIDVEKQRKLMKYIKPDFVFSLIVRNSFAEISLRTLLMAVRYMDLEMNQADIECIIAQLYEPIETAIALLAGKLFHISNITPFAYDAPANIVRLLELNAESSTNSKIASEELLIDSVYMHICKQINWPDWIRVIADSPADNVAHALNLLCAFLSKATTNYTPPIRIKQIVEAKSNRNELIENRRKFTSVFSSGWLEIASYKKVRLSAPQKLVQLAQYFDESLDPKIMKEIAYILCGLHHSTADPRVSDECTKSLDHLVSLVLDSGCFHSSEESNDTVHVLVQSLVKVVQKDFIKLLSTYPSFMNHCDLVQSQNTLVMRKMISVCQWLTFDDNHLWHFAMGKITSVSVISLSQHLIQTLLTLLFQMVMKSADRVIAAQQELSFDAFNRRKQIELNIMTSTFVTRALHFKLEARHFLNKNFSSSLRSSTFYALLDLLEFSLANFHDHNPLLAQISSLDDDEIHALLSYSLEFMEYSQCNQQCRADVNVRCCCFAISRICDLISRGFLDIHLGLTPFIKFIGQNVMHDEIVIKCLCDYCWMFPLKWENIAISIFNSLISLLDNTLIKYVTPGNSIEEYENALMWTSVQHLAEILNEIKFKEPVIRTAWLKLHTHIINCALGPSGHASLLRVLYTFKHLLFPEDMCFVTNYLLQYYHSEAKTKNLDEIEAYLRFLNKIPPRKHLMENPIRV